MKKEAASAAFYEPEHFGTKRCPKLQILTIEDLLAGKEVVYPRVAPAVTFQAAEPKTKVRKGDNRLL